jgi:hypothetical protein
MMTTQGIGIRRPGLLVLIGLLCAGMASVVPAAPLASQTEAQAFRRAQETEVVQALDLEPVRARLASLGLDRAEVEAAIARMDADELAQLSAHAERIEAGSMDATGWVIAAVILAFVWILARYSTWWGWTRP